MTRARSMVALAALIGSGCATEPDAGDAQLLVPDEIEFYWNDAYNDVGDRVGAFIPLDIMVYDTESGEPVAWTEVALSGEFAGLLPGDAVTDAWLADCVDCVEVYDVFRDDQVAIGLLPSSTLRVSTDDSGLARVYAVVDSLPVDADADFVPAGIHLVSGGLEASVALVTD